MNLAREKYINEVISMLERLADLNDETAVSDGVKLRRKINKSRQLVSDKNSWCADLYRAQEDRKDFYKPKLTVLQGGNDFLARKSKAQLTLVKAA